MLIRFSLCIGLITFLAVPNWIQSGTRPDFSGTWELNLAKSKLQIPPPTSSTFYITHKDPVFSLKRTHVYGEKSNTWSIELITDGPEIVQKGEVDIYARIFWQRDALVFQSHWTDEGITTTNVVECCSVHSQQSRYGIYCR